MADGNEQASGSDRAAAVKLVEAALASGRIVAADRDMRLNQIKSAQTATEVEMVTRDLQPHTPAPNVYEGGTIITPNPDARPATPADLLSMVNYGGAGGASSLGRSVKVENLKIPKIAFLLPAVIGVVVIGAFALGVFAFVNDAVETVGGGGGITDSQTYAPGIEPDDGINVLSVKGYQDLVGALRDETGSSETFSAVLYPTYAVLELPVDDTSQRSDRYYWNGALESQQSFGTSTEQRYDIDEVDPAVMISLLKKVRSRVEAPTIWYATIEAPAADGSVISVHTSNEYSESAYILATIDGTITYEYTSTQTATPEPEVEQ